MESEKKALLNHVACVFSISYDLKKLVKNNVCQAFLYGYA